MTISPNDDHGHSLSDSCLDECTIRRLVQGESIDYDLEACAAHLATCEDCSAEFDRLLIKRPPIPSDIWMLDEDTGVAESGWNGKNYRFWLDALPFKDRFQFVKKISRGSMGEVYKAFDLKLSRTVAIKVIREDRVRPGETERIMNEACFQAALIHPNIATIHDLGLFENLPVIVMEYLSAGSLQEMIRYSPCTPIFASCVLAPIARALHYAHTCGVIHCDIKPSNILMTPGYGFGVANGSQFVVPKLADFGLARDQGEWSTFDPSGKACGTLPYCAPELFSLLKSKNTQATDIYAFGVTLYEALTGRPPFRSQSAQDLIESIVDGDFVMPREFDPLIDQEIEEVCLKCLEKNPAHRYPDALERFSLAYSDDYRSDVFRGGPEDEGLFDGSQRTGRRCR